MRDIKFRAWVKNESKMMSVVGISWMLNIQEEDVEVGSVLCAQEDNGAWSAGGDHEADDVVLMQYSGLKDKNGVEIYEGDIVRSNHFIDYKGEQQFLYHIIKWSDKRSAYFALNADTMNEGDGSTLLLSYFSNALGITVVGNIYENTGLLEE